MVTSATSIGSIFQSQAESSADKSNKLFSDNGEMYLGLFLTQLKNQDPTQPFDTEQMTQQLSQLNSSQQMIQTNKNLEQLISQNKSAQASSLASFINKDIEYLGDTFYRDGIVSKEFSYSLDTSYSKVDIEVRDSNNNLVLRTSGINSAGDHKFTWDGKDSSGNIVDYGTYKISSVTTDSDGAIVEKNIGETAYAGSGKDSEFSYLIDKQYSNVDIEIRDENDQLIIKVPGDKSTGSHKFTWDGKDSIGNNVAAGTYKILAVTKDGAGNFGNASTLIKDTVTGIDFSTSAEPVAIVGSGSNKIGVDLSRIASVANVSTAANSNSIFN